MRGGILHQMLNKIEQNLFMKNSIVLCQIISMEFYCKRRFVQLRIADAYAYFSISSTFRYFAMRFLVSHFFPADEIAITSVLIASLASDIDIIYRMAWPFI